MTSSSRRRDSSSTASMPVSRRSWSSMPRRSPCSAPRIGPHPLLTFADMTVVGANPARIIPAWQSFVDDHRRRPSTARHRSTRLGRSHRAGAGGVRAARVPVEPRVLGRREHVAHVPVRRRIARRGHRSGAPRGPIRRSPIVTGEGRARSKASMPPPHRSVRPCRRRPICPETLSFDAGDPVVGPSMARRPCRIARSFRSGRRSRARCGRALVQQRPSRRGSRRRARLVRDGAVVCEVVDAGSITDPLAGRRRPTTYQESGFGCGSRTSSVISCRSGPSPMGRWFVCTCGSTMLSEQRGRLRRRGPRRLAVSSPPASER